jgi:hypothetical protein
MKSTIAALISAAVITPAVADATLPGPDKSPPTQVQAKKDEKAGKASAKERARVAKAKKKSSRKQDKPVAPKAS